VKFLGSYPVTGVEATVDEKRSLRLDDRRISG